MKSIGVGDTMLFLLLRMKQILFKEESEFFIIISWQLWNIRNRLMHGGCSPNSKEVISWCSTYLEELKKLI